MICNRAIRNVLVGLLFITTCQPAFTSITATGDISPPDPAAAPPGRRIDVGVTGTGSLTIDQGNALISKNAYIANVSGSQGTVTVTGTGSFWGVRDWLNVGFSGNGELLIQDGAIVDVGQSTSIAINPTSQGTIRFDNGTLITASLFADLKDLTGTGTLHTNGLIADGVDISVRSSYLPAEPFQLNQNPGQDITVYLSPDERGILGAGFNGTGSLTIDQYHTVDSRYGLIGYQSGSFGTVTARGNWNIRQGLEVGRRGRGILRIEEDSVVTVQGGTTVGRVFNTDSVIEFNNGELKTGTLAVFPSQLLGNGTIYTQGLFADGFDLVFDAQHGTTQTIQLNSQPDQDITIRLDLGKDSTLGAGYKGVGTLTIRDGVQVDSLSGSLGYFDVSSGIADVSGEGTRWRIHSSLDVGRVGDGELTIRDGALVMTDFLSTRHYEDGEEITNKSYINLTNGGMFAIKGKTYPSNITLTDFYERFLYSSSPQAGTLRYWNPQQSTWANLTQATPGVDYSIEYFDAGKLAGYTVLTVGTVPEPHTLALVGFGLTLCMSRRSRKP
jgi:T5SS/PEP-CTERM-associated repeat protein